VSEHQTHHRDVHCSRGSLQRTAIESCKPVTVVLAEYWHWRERAAHSTCSEANLTVVISSSCWPQQYIWLISCTCRLSVWTS